MNVTEDSQYVEIYNALADLVTVSEAPALASIYILNAALAVTLSTLGPDRLARVLETARANIPQDCAPGRLN